VSADVKKPTKNDLAVDTMKRATRGITGRDFIAGITNAVTNIPDAMASAVLAGLNPIQGLYAIMVGTPVSALTTSSQLMTVAVTGAMALIVGDSLAPLAAADKLEALIVLTVLVAVVQIALGLARAGTLVRFVSNAVLQGFLFGVAVNIVLSQISDLTGYSSDLPGKVGKAVDTLLHPGQIDLQLLGLGLATIAIVILVEKTPAKDFSFLVALVVATLGAILLNWDIPTVQSLGEIPRALPKPTMPSLSLVAGLMVPAISIALVGLIQSAGVSKGTPNADGTYPDMNRDFIGQGVGNAASGLFGGMPIGGSVSSTALVKQLGATSRIANFIVGPIIAVVVLLFSGAVEVIPLATLAGLLVIIGIRAIKPGAIKTVWQTGLPPRIIMLTTFVAVLMMPIQYAVLLGVVLSVLQYVYSSSLDVRVVVLEPNPDGTYAEKPAPEVLSDDQVTVVDIYGSVFYAGADIIGGLLPKAGGSHRPAVVLRLRGRADIGSTFLGIVERYRGEIEQAGGILLLAGVGPELHEQLERTGVLDAIGEDRVCEAQSTLTASVSVAVDSAQQWLDQSTGDK
jgi:SulP family sulfate permease